MLREQARELPDGARQVGRRQNWPRSSRLNGGWPGLARGAYPSVGPDGSTVVSAVMREAAAESGRQGLRG